MALRQNTIASDFLGGGKDAARVLALEVVLGMWNEELAGLEKNASEAESRHRAARSVLVQFKKLLTLAHWPIRIALTPSTSRSSASTEQQPSTGRRSPVR